MTYLVNNQKMTEQEWRAFQKQEMLKGNTFAMTQVTEDTITIKVIKRR